MNLALGAVRLSGYTTRPSVAAGAVRVKERWTAAVMNDESDDPLYDPEDDHGLETEAQLLFQDMFDDPLSYEEIDPYD